MADNASNNDAMIRELNNVNMDFGGASAQGRCFLHTTNLTAKSLICLFDPREQWKNEEICAEDVEDRETIDLKDEGTLGRVQLDDGENGEGLNDDDDGWVDEVNVLMVDERNGLLETIKPVESALMKVDLVIYLTR